MAAGNLVIVTIGHTNTCQLWVGFMAEDIRITEDNLPSEVRRRNNSLATPSVRSERWVGEPAHRNTSPGCWIATNQPMVLVWTVVRSVRTPCVPLWRVGIPPNRSSSASHSR